MILLGFHANSTGRGYLFAKEPVNFGGISVNV